jgi:hypothetical protein
MTPADPVVQLGVFVASLVANLLSALAGGGAGLVQLPVLILLGLSFPLALATHKVASVALGIGATLRHLRERSLNPHLGACCLKAKRPQATIFDLGLQRCARHLLLIVEPFHVMGSLIPPTLWVGGMLPIP